MAIIQRRKQNASQSTQPDALSTQVNKQRYDNEIVISVTGINFRDTRIFNNTKTSDGNKICTVRPHNGVAPKDGDDFVLDIIINADRIEDFKAIIPKIIEELSKSKSWPKTKKNPEGGYTEEYLRYLENKLYRSLESIPTSKELNDTREVMTQNWKNMLNKINDPEVRKRLIKKSFYYTKNVNGEMKGVELSDRNINYVLMQRPGATFVTNTYTWFECFNRTVRQGAQYILVSKPSYIYATKEQRDSIAQEYYGMTYKEAYEKFKEKGENMQQFDHGINKGITKKYGVSNFYYEKVYDISDTELIPGKKDVFFEKIGIKDNVNNGEVQGAEYNADVATSDNAGVDAKIGFKSEILEAYKDWLLKKLSKEGIKMPNTATESTEDIIARAIFNYSFNNAEKLNQVTTEARTDIALAVSVAICSYLGLQSNVTTDYIRRLNSKVFTDETARLSWALFTELLPNESRLSGINKDNQQQNTQYRMVSEAIQETSFESFVDILKRNGVRVISNREQVAESFFSYLIRMDNSKRNLLI